MAEQDLNCAQVGGPVRTVVWQGSAGNRRPYVRD
jgi:hypothetical protein